MLGKRKNNIWNYKHVRQYEIKEKETSKKLGWKQYLYKQSTTLKKNYSQIL